MPIINKNELYLFHLANFRNTETTNKLGTIHLKQHRELSTALIRAAPRAEKMWIAVEITDYMYEK